MSIMKSKFALVLSIFLLLGLLFSPSIAFGAQTKRATPKVVTPSPSPTPISRVDSYQLFWPISAGRVMGDPLHFLKNLKENLRGILIFGDYNKAIYDITLSEKRLVEAEYLFMVKKDYVNGKRAIDASKQNLEKAVSLSNKVVDQTKITDLKVKLSASLEKQRKLLNYLASQASDENKKVLAAQEDYISNTLSDLQ